MKRLSRAPPHPVCRIPYIFLVDAGDVEALKIVNDQPDYRLSSCTDEKCRVQAFTFLAPF